MDESRFDTLTRAFASGATRRAVLKSVAAALAGAGGLIGTHGVRAACRPPGAICRKPGECCTDICGPKDATGRSRCACPPGLIPCQDVCKDPADFVSDPLNCGDCNVVCPSGVCVAGACLKLNGEACVAGTECLSTFCADGVCCDGACGGQCEACDATGACLPVSGAPAGARPACASHGAVCGGACDGTNRAACAYPDATTACGDPVCRDGDAVNLECNSQGSCVERTTDCGLFACRSGACLATCQTNDDCLGEAYCAAGVCTADKALGQSCGGRDECQSGFCVDGVCCNNACAGQCEACDVAPSVGTCSPVPAGAAPRGDRQACGGSGACAGACNGTDRTACAFPGPMVSCGASTCRDDDAVSFACNGAGACAESVDDCGAFRCRDGVCLTECATNDDCASPNVCFIRPFGSDCREPRPAGGFCDNNDQCASRRCTSGFCCDSDCPTPANGRATCVDGQTCGIVCNGGFKPCSGTCIPVSTCCPQTENCSITCPPGTVCNGVCVDTNTHAGHCGACNKPCFEGGTCVGGRCRCGTNICLQGESCLGDECSCCGVACQTPASGGPPVCGRSCFDDLRQCAFGETCDFGSGPVGTCRCAGLAAPGFCPEVAAGDTCVGGQCCDACPSGELPAVVTGVCTCLCGTGPGCGIRGHCVGGQCRCGVGPSCASGQRCSIGMCCPEAQASCNGVCRSTSSDPDFCGDSCIDCGDGATCSNGRCVCNPGATPCPRAERCVDGACRCGNDPSCGPGLVCSNGKCVDPGGSQLRPGLRRP